MTETLKPTHLNPSELGTKEYWDEHYERDLDGAQRDDDDDGELTDEKGCAEEAFDLSDLQSWFDDVGAPAKTFAFLTSTTFPLSPNYVPSSEDMRAKPQISPSVLDLGTGNGNALFTLRLQGAYHGPMVGIDYSQKSIELATKLREQYMSFPSIAADTSAEKTKLENLEFHVYDIINDTPQTQQWWPASPNEANSGFDLVLDKGTFDAISLSPETLLGPGTDRPQRICELYPRKVLQMVKTGGFLMVTSCNWTEREVVSWFTAASAQSEETDGKFEVYDTIKYPIFEFGGQKGQAVASVCFRKVALK